MHDLAEDAAEFGVAYLLTGMQHAARLVVSLCSLREWYNGPVTVFTTREESHAIGELCALEPSLRVIHRTFREIECGDTSSYVSKVALLKYGAYDATLLLDTDTLVTGDISELIAAVCKFPLTVTASGRTTSSTQWYMQLLRDEWRPLQAASGGELDLSRLLEIAETVPQHGINAGVVGVRRGAPILDRWLEVSHRASALAIPDEMALHLLLPLCEYAILGQRYNCWPLYFPNVRDVRIWHFVGCTHLRPGKSSQLWRPAYEECRRRDTARITQWSKIESRNGTVERPSL